METVEKDGFDGSVEEVGQGGFVTLRFVHSTLPLTYSVPLLIFKPTAMKVAAFGGAGLERYIAPAAQIEMAAAPG